MIQNSYLQGFMYHMVHVDNIHSIFLHKELMSQEILRQRNITPRSIANNSVQRLRVRVFIWDFHEGRYRSLHSYVPFYLGTYPPMLYVQLNAGLQSELVIFKVLRSMLRKQGTVFTDGNATNQRLSQDRNEKVYIVPAKIHADECIRKYSDGGPHGTSQLVSSIFCDVSFLNTLDWAGINKMRYIEDWEEAKRVRSAEALIPDRISITEICGIAVNTVKMVGIVNAMIGECGVTDLVPRVTCEPVLFQI